MNHGEYRMAKRLVELVHRAAEGFHPGYRRYTRRAGFTRAALSPQLRPSRSAAPYTCRGDPVPVTVRHSARVLPAIPSAWRGVSSPWRSSWLKEEHRTKSELFREVVRVYRSYRKRHPEPEIDEEWVVQAIREAETEEKRNPITDEEFLKEFRELA